MARYFDADELLKKLPDDLPYKASVKRVLMQAPAADVVPRAEIRNMFVELQTLIDEYLDGLYGTAEFIDIFHNLEKKFTEEK